MPDPTAATHVFVGMFRPPWSEVLKYLSQPRAVGVVPTCPHGHELKWNWGAVWNDAQRCWEFGCFDTPVYVTIEEVLKAKPHSVWTRTWRSAGEGVAMKHLLETTLKFVATSSKLASPYEGIMRIERTVELLREHFLGKKDERNLASTLLYDCLRFLRDGCGFTFESKETP